MDEFFEKILPILITFGIPIFIGIVSSSKKKKKRSPVFSENKTEFNSDSSGKDTSQEIENLFDKEEETSEKQYQSEENKNVSIQESKTRLEEEWERSKHGKDNVKKAEKEKEQGTEKKEKGTILENYEEGEQMTEYKYEQYETTNKTKRKDVISRIQEDFDLEEAIIYSEIINRKHF